MANPSNCVLRKKNAAADENSASGPLNFSHRLVDVRRSDPDTDAVKVRSGRHVLVFNIRRHDYRLIVAAQFNRQIVYALRFMTPAEYSKNLWQESL